MKKDLFLSIIGVCFFSLAAAQIGTAQQDVTARSISADGFKKNRTETGPPKGKGTLGRKPHSYSGVRAVKNFVGRKPGKLAPTEKTPSNSEKKSVTEIGVTIWTLRPPVNNEPGYYFRVLDEKDGKKVDQKWIAERVGVDSVFSPTDKLRFAVESTQAGYLYVIGRESYSNGTFGDPYGVFPEGDEDNRIIPGMLFDYPDQNDTYPYLKLNTSKALYAGEVMTIIISPKPLTIMKKDAKGNLLDSDELADLEYGSDVEVFSRTDLSDRIYSQSEAGSACGVKTRELVREKAPAKPCGAAVGQLSREDPEPQSIYHVKVSPGRPAVAFIKLNVK